MLDERRVLIFVSRNPRSSWSLDECVCVCVSARMLVHALRENGIFAEITVENHPKNILG